MTHDGRFKFPSVLRHSVCVSAPAGSFSYGIPRAMLGPLLSLEWKLDLASDDAHYHLTLAPTRFSNFSVSTPLVYHRNS